MAARQPGEADVSPPLTSATIGGQPENALHLSDSEGDGVPMKGSSPPHAGRSSSDQRYPRPGSGSQRRSVSRRPGGGAARAGYSSDREFDNPPGSNRSIRSSRPLRYDDRGRDEWDDDYYYDERDYWRDRERDDWARHPDSYTRRPPPRNRGPPPRAYLNRPPMDDTDYSASPSKPYFDETRSKAPRQMDEEMGYAGSSNDIAVPRPVL